VKVKKIFVPMITPFTPANNVCETSVRNIIKQCSTYAHGIVPCLTSGEGWLLNEEQWIDMVRLSIKYAGPMKIIAGIERSTTSEVIEYVKLAESLDVSGVMITTPFGNNVSQHEMIRHYQEVHEKSNCEIWIYHEEQISKNLLSLESLFIISAFERVVGIKDSSSTMLVVNNVLTFSKHSVRVYHGMEERLTCGGDISGNIVSLSNLEPELCVNACYNVEDNKFQNVVNCFCDNYSLASENWYRFIKSELFSRGVISSDYVINIQTKEKVTIC